MKTEGFKKEYFDNFIKFKQNLNIKTFKKERIINDIVNFISGVTENYRLYGDQQIFTTGTPKEENYNETILENYLKNIKYEKSFFGVNCKNNIDKNQISKFLESTSKQVLKYYNADFFLGKIPNNFKNRIKETSIDGLKIRDTNPYFSDKIGNDIPCYENKSNKKSCKDLNEFDFKKEEKYNATLFNESDQNYITYYQIDKSSESFLVNVYCEFTIEENEIFTDDIYVSILQNFLMFKLTELDEVYNLILFSIYNTTINMEFECFTDNIEKVFGDFINYFKEAPKENEFNYEKNNYINIFNSQDLPLIYYSMDIADRFSNKGEEDAYNITEEIEKIKNFTFEDFKNLHNNMLKITSSLLKIAGNINENLVQKLHEIIKNNIPLSQKFFSFFQSNEIENLESSSYVVNYYQKCELTNEIDNAIVVDFKVAQKYDKYIYILTQCLYNIGMIYLRFNYSNSYGVSVFQTENGIRIYEQGRYKDPTQMNDDINRVIQGMINGNITCENYRDIVDSFIEMKKMNISREKTYDSLVVDFFYENEFIEEEENEEEEVKYPDKFTDFMKLLSPIFTEPKRFSILIARSDISDGDLKELVENRKNNEKKYILNESIMIEHTEDIYYMKTKGNDTNLNN